MNTKNVDFFIDQSVSEETLQVAKKYLIQDEELLWVGKPARGILFWIHYILPWIILNPMALLLIGGSFAINGAVRVYQDSFLIALILGVLGLGLLSIGIVTYWIPLTRRLQIYNKLIYLVTDKRAMMIVDEPFKRMKSVSLNKVMELQLSQNLSGLGTIIFGKPWMFQARWDEEFYPKFLKFEQIKDPQMVFNLIEERQMIAQEEKKQRWF